MLLIVTERGDLTADWLILELDRREAPFVRFNTEDYPLRAGLAWTPEGSTLKLKGRTHALNAFTAVWYRRPVAPQLPPGLGEERALWVGREAREALLGAWRTLDALWVNHPDRNRTAESKPEQLRTATAMGFEVPASLVTNQAARVRAFMADHPQDVVCKPLWDGRVPDAHGREQLFFTTRVDRNDLDLNALGPEPYLFQELVPKRYDVRVTVIGGKAFAASIDSQAGERSRTDWRRGRPGALEHHIEDLPDEVAERCTGLCRHYGLQFGAIDLARRTDGGYSFFEVNPNGQWAWVEQRTGLPLRARLADLLLSETRR